MPTLPFQGNFQCSSSLKEAYNYVKRRGPWIWSVFRYYTKTNQQKVSHFHKINDEFRIMQVTRLTEDEKHLWSLNNLNRLHFDFSALWRSSHKQNYFWITCFFGIETFFYKLFKILFVKLLNRFWNYVPLKWYSYVPMMKKLTPSTKCS